MCKLVHSMWSRQISARILVFWVTMILSISLPSRIYQIEKVQCSRESSFLVRKFLRNKWYPILERYGAKLPLECPLHPQREIFWKQEAGKGRHRSNQWTCLFCGKSFQSEKFIDTHMEKRHEDCLYLSEDAVCLADFCDVFRCEVLEALRQRDLRNPMPEFTTDIDIWKDQDILKSALQKTASRDLILYQKPKKDEQKGRYNSCSKMKQDQQSVFMVTRDKYPQKQDCLQSSLFADCRSCSEHTNQNGTELPVEDEIWIAYRKQKALCNEEKMQKVKQKCEDMVGLCTANLLASMSTKDFKDLYAELRRSLCDFLSCSRYWEDIMGGDRKFPWIAAGLLVILLSFGVCIAYYIVWGITEEEAPVRIVPAIKKEIITENLQTERKGRSRSQGCSKSICNEEHPKEGNSTLPRKIRHHREDVSGDREDELSAADDYRRRSMTDKLSGHTSSLRTLEHNDVCDESLWPVVEEESDVEDLNCH
ncbi:uncharacterized protein LOC136032649 isoform X2 [Artemia franciscana]|uniref:C2H2-type domain-containing protein n=1 Tax=Artemia franciscana TaxID=6661 RepID=A0AA88IBB1_ARTSF|nr:hypothetical protein QYM36_001581 [Artemia franciscana]